MKNTTDTNRRRLAERKHLPHESPAWVGDGAIYFITICAVPRGMNQLCLPETAASLRESLIFRQTRGEWWVHLLLFMPDHLHALMSFAPSPGMRRSVAQWKRYVAREFHVHWQDGFFDHRLRNDENYREKAHYVRMNPVRAGLVERSEDWPCVWSSYSRGVGGR